MLTDKNNLDQLFQSKLGEYEKTPPAFLWDHIENELNAHERGRKIARLKSAGIAAAVLLAFMAGWWLTNPSATKLSHQTTVESTLIQDSKITDSKNNQASAQGSLYLDSDKKDNGTQIDIGGKQYKPSIASIAAFAPNTSFLKKSNEDSLIGAKATVLVDVEKEFLSHYQNNLKLIKQLSDWVFSLNNNFNRPETIRENKKIEQLNKQFTVSNLPLYSQDSKTDKVSKAGKWSLSAGLAPVFTSVKQNTGYGSGQITATGNSFAGGVMTGYQIGKRIVMKSGIIYSQLNQSTKNVEFTSANSTAEFFGRASQVNTPSGNIRFNKVTPLKNETLLSYTKSLTYSIQSDLKQDFGYVEIPVQATYKIIDRKFNLGVTGGIGTNILVGNKANLYENGQRINSGETANLRDVTYSGAVGLEFGYDLGNKITFIIEPRIKHFLNSLSSDNSVDFRPYQIDIVTGVTYSFN